MKIVIKSETPFAIALEKISQFLTENYNDYPMLKSNMNIYVTLKNSNGQNCPDNEKEYILTGEDVKDVFREEKKLSNQIKNYENYLATSKDKKRKKENIEKRREEYSKHKQQYESQNKKLQLLIDLDEVVKSGEFITYYIKTTHRLSYKYNLETIFIFDNINGYTGYFNHWGLQDGLPPEY